RSVRRARLGLTPSRSRSRLKRPARSGGERARITGRGKSDQAPDTGASAMQAPPRPRLAALDSFRGLTVAGMIIVNTPGSAEHVWWPLDDAGWHGFTPTDLVFPASLRATAVALGLPFP